MGSFFSSDEKHYKILVTGLDASGKTTMMYKLKINGLDDSVPMIGLYMERGRYKNFDITSWDSGGRTRMDNFRKKQIQGIEGVVYVVDSNDPCRIGEAAEDLKLELKVAEHDRKPTDAPVPLLIFANKMDMPAAMTEEVIIDKLGLRSMTNRPWHVQSSCATEGIGLHEGLEWLIKQVKQTVNGISVACDLNSNKASVSCK